MAQYLMSVLVDSPTLASAEEDAAIDVFNDALRANGHWVFAGGLEGPDHAAVLDGRGADPIVTDGPFVETKEFIVGFWVVEAADDDVARELAAQGSKACNRRVELRRFLSL